jgi:curved DNA-binding protein CbpA
MSSIPMRPPNLYHVLHVQPDAPVEIIRTSYRTLMQGLARHPDLGGDTAAAALINEAFETLKDPGRRAAYDQTLASAGAPDRNSQPEALACASPAQPEGDSRPGVHTAATRACLFCGEPHVERQSRMPDAQCSRCGSPLCSAPAAARSKDSRRGFHRTLHLLHVHCEVKGTSTPFQGISENLSVAGLRFVTPEKVMLDQVVRVDCEFCSAVGVVRYAREASGRSRRWWEVGIEFKTVHLKQMRGGLVSASA